MAFDRIETPPAPGGSEQEQLERMYRYMVRLAEELNIQLENIGGNDLTDSERLIMNRILLSSAAENLPEDQVQQELYQMESLKSLIIKTAAFVQTSLQEYRLNLLSETVAEGKFGRYVRNTGLDVAVTPEGITQNYTFQEVVQGLREFEINAKNYIKTGLLRTENGLPVYGVQIGKDIVTFAADGTETYHDGNKVAELTADELSFWQGGAKIASYTGTEIALYQGGYKAVSITAADGVRLYQNNTLAAQFKSTRIGLYTSGTEKVYLDSSGQLHCNEDLYIDSNKKLIISSTNFTIDASGNVTVKGKVTATELWIGSSNVLSNDKILLSALSDSVYTQTQTDSAISTAVSGKYSIVSGITITSSGVDVSGSQYVKIASGGYFQVTTGNFGIDTNTAYYVMWSGGTIPASAPFRLSPDGTIYCKKLVAEDASVSGASTITGNTNIITTYNTTTGNGYSTYQNSGGTNSWKNSYDGGLYTITGSYGTRTFAIGNASVLATASAGIGFEVSNLYPSYQAILSICGAAGINFYSSYGDNSCVTIQSESGYTYLYMTGTNTGRIGYSSKYWGEAYITTIYGTVNSSSSERVKHGIREMEAYGSRIDALRPVSFIYNEDSEERRRLGLIWEEAVNVLPEICWENGDGLRSISYVELVPVLLKEIQNLRSRVNALEAS